jgi:hypothetical protein
MTSIQEQLRITEFSARMRQSLSEDVSEQNRRLWADLVLARHIPVTSLVNTVLEPHPAGMRFIWMIGGLCDKRPEVIYPAVRDFYEVREKVTFRNYDRSLAKMFHLAGIPQEMEGEITDQLFKWLMDPLITVTTKEYAMLALLKVVRKHPDIKGELRAVLEDQMERNTPAFRKKVARVLLSLRDA